MEFIKCIHIGELFILPSLSVSNGTVDETGNYYNEIAIHFSWLVFTLTLCFPKKED